MNNLYSLQKGKEYIISGEVWVNLKGNKQPIKGLNVRGQYYNGEKWCDSVNVLISENDFDTKEFSVRFRIDDNA